MGLSQLLRRPHPTALLPFAAAAVLGASALANTYVVDASNGPGTHFVSLSTAVAVAVDGDVLLVRAGSYGSPDLQKGLTLLCDPGAMVTKLSVRNLPAGRVAAITGLEAGELDVLNCAGTVVLQHIDADASGTSVSPVLDVSASSDVRIYRSAILAGRRAVGSVYGPGYTAARVSSSRTEFVRCTIKGGGQGPVANVFPDPGFVGDGGPGIEANLSSTVHVALSDVTGGDGADLPSFWQWDTMSGSGGAAIKVSGGSNAVVAGTRGQRIQGGPCGVVAFYGYEGSGGRAVVASGGSARVSGCIFRPGGGLGSPFFGPVTQVFPADPSADRLGNGAAGSTLRLRVYGAPGAVAELDEGVTPIVAPSGGPIPVLVASLAHFMLPAIPSNTSPAEFTTVIPASDAAGTLYVWQGRAPASGGLAVFTNAVPVIVR